MTYQLSDRIANLKPSLVREILKATANPSVIPFAAGNPAPDAFPVQDLARIAGDIFATRPIDALQYSITEGYPALCDKIKSMLENHYHIPMRDNGLMILSGAQQGADLACKVLVNEGDTILCEDPSFIGCLNCFRSYNCNLVGVAMESDGVDTEKLEQTIKENKNVKLFYTIPNFQNPTGITTSLEKRREIYRICKKYNVMILEDNPYGDLRFSGERIPSIKSFDDDGAVIYIGSFSKIVAPGMRVGFALAPKPLISKMTVGKQCEDVHTNILAQMIIEQFLSTSDIEAHIAKIAGIYRRKSQLMLDCIEQEFAPSITHTTPQGGLFLWCTLPEGADMMEFCRQAAAKNVAVVPGIAFLADQTSPCRSFRMNFSTPTDEAIVKGITILGKLSKELF